jgi:hypothetical protein
MRSCLTIFYTLLSATLTIAQVSGRVVDVSYNPLSFASILLLSPQDSSLVKGVVSDSDGKFSIIGMSSGKFLLSIRMIGYQTQTIPVEGSTILSNPIVLEEESYELDEIVVKADRPLFEQRIDKLVVNVENSIVSTGGSVLDVLEKSPGVSVNRQSGSMNMNGKQGVQVMINGKLQRLPLNMVVQQLEGLAASNVDKIELITNPSSRYDAEGDAGIINIVTKKNTDYGVNGTATLGIGYGTYTGYWKPAGSLNINYKNRSISLYSNYSNNSDRRWQQWNYERQVLNPDQYSLTVSDRYVRWPIQRANLGAEWTVSKQTSVNVLLTVFSNIWKMEAYNDSRISQNGTDSARIKLYDVETNHWKHGMTSLNVRHTFSNGDEINIDADYLYYHDYNPNDFINDYSDQTTNTSWQEQVRIRKETPINMGVFKIDYVKRIKDIKLEVGAKSTFSRLQNRVSLETLKNENWTANPLFTQNYELKDDVTAVYASLNGKVKTKGQFQFGLRAESTDMIMNTEQGNVFSFDFWSIFPSVFYTHQVTPNRSWQISYGRRITRPAYTDVAPFVIFMDPFTYYWGNPKLKPSISDGLQTSYSHKDLLLTLRYSYDRHSIARNQSRFDDVERKTYIFTDNVDRLQLYSLAVSLPVTVTAWWKVQANGLFTYQRIDHSYNDVLLSLEQLSVRISVNQSFSLSNNFTFELSGVFVAPRRIGLSVLKSQADVSVGVQKKFQNNSKLNVNINDIFWTTLAKYRVRDPLLNQIQQTTYINEPRVVRVSYTFNFGNKNMKASRQRSTASELEQQRVN